MGTIVRFTTVAAACLASASVIGLGGSWAEDPSPATGTTAPVGERITLNTPWEGGVFHYIDLGKPDVGPGDMFTLTGLPVRSEETGERVGALDAVETILSSRHDGTVRQEMTFRFAGGTVAVAGNLRHTDRPIRLPVVGGTADYTGVTGQLRELGEDSKRKVSVTRLILVR